MVTNDVWRLMFQLIEAVSLIVKPGTDAEAKGVRQLTMPASPAFREELREDCQGRKQEKSEQKFASLVNFFLFIYLFIHSLIFLKFLYLSILVLLVVGSLNKNPSLFLML